MLGLSLEVALLGHPYLAKAVVVKDWPLHKIPKTGKQVMLFVVFYSFYCKCIYTSLQIIRLH
jgi:hypothetical protein